MYLTPVKAMCCHRWEWQHWPSSPEPWPSGCLLFCPELHSSVLKSPATPMTGAMCSITLYIANPTLQPFNNAVSFCIPYSYIFGAVTVATGILGGGLGTSLSRHFRDKVPNADPIICAVGMLGSVPCLFITIFVASVNIPTTYVRPWGQH